MDDSTSENDNESVDGAEYAFQLGAEEIISHSIMKQQQQEGGKFLKRGAYGSKSDPEKSDQSVKVAKKRGRKSRFPLITCTHQNACHFTKSMVEDALRENNIAIVLNHVSAYSPIWSFCGFPEINGQVCTSWVVCTICRAVFSFVNATTSGAKRHVIMKHVPKSETVEDMALAARLERVKALNSMIPSYAEEGEEVAQGNGEHKDLTESQVRVIFDDGYEEARSNCIRANRRTKRRRQRPLTFDPREEALNSCDSQSPPRTRESTTTGGAANVGGGSQNTRCSLCNVDFNNSALAMMHQSCHGSSKRFDCAQCRIVFPNVFDFWAHLYTRDCNTVKK